jgi:hypothetical protein
MHAPNARGMSALPPKADKSRQARYVCFVPKADICIAADFLFDHLVGEREQWSIDLDQTVYRHNAKRNILLAHIRG